MEQMPNEKIRQLREKSMKLPLTPGVYIMKNKSGKIIYIGKAKALKNRVSQYFGSPKNHSVKVRKMVENVDDFDYILTDSEFEALVLECSLIKQNMPKYNILLKDSKGYSYIKITPNPWGNISACYRKDDDKAKYMGPYTGNFSVTNAVDEAKEIFKLPTCSKSFPRDIGKSRPCLNFFISRCCAPCARKISEKDYEENLSQAIEFIKGGSKKTLANLNEKMLSASENLEFEKAAALRDKIKAIEKITSRQKVVCQNDKNQDIFAVAQSSERACLAVLNFRQGLLCGSDHFIFQSSENLSETRNELITSYYMMNRDIPPKIIVDGEVYDEELLTMYLEKLRGHKVELVRAQKGESAKLCEMCLKNASQKLGEYLGQKGTETAALDELAKALGLSKPPEYIESYDISHTAGSDNVAGMVVFKNGRAYKKAYKRFSVKGFDGQDDYGSMREVITRRLNRYEQEKGTDSTFATLPDLILLDGGQGQVGAVKPVIEKFGLDIPVFGMVKDSKHRTRAIASTGHEIAINDGRRVFTLVSTIQEEVHRFAITYHKTKHAKGVSRSSLTEIPGIGEKKAKILLKAFKSVAAIRRADAQALENTKGISKKDAQNIYEYFHKD